MKTFNVTAQVYDLNSSNPRQSILINELIKSKNTELAKDLFKLSMFDKNITVQKILSIEEIPQVAV